MHEKLSLSITNVFDKIFFKENKNNNDKTKLVKLFNKSVWCIIHVLRLVLQVLLMRFDSEQKAVKRISDATLSKGGYSIICQQEYITVKFPLRIQYSNFWYPSVLN